MRFRLFVAYQLKGTQKLLKLLRSLCPALANPDTVFFDLGHGLGQVQYFLDANSPAIGIEQAPELHCLAKECGLLMNHQRRVSFRCMSSHDVVSFDGVHVILQYEGMAARKSAADCNYQAGHIKSIEKMLMCRTLLVFTSTKMQRSLLEEYCARSDIIRDEMHAWTVIKVHNVRRRGNNPLTWIYIRSRALFDDLALPDDLPASMIDEMVEASKQRAQGVLWAMEPSGSQALRRYTSKHQDLVGSPLDSTLDMVFGDLTLTCFFTGLRVMMGDTIFARGDRQGTLVGFASSAGSLAGRHSPECPDHTE